MKWLLSLRPEAVDDISLAQDWYAEKSRRLADAFLDDVALALRELERAPELQRYYFRNFRRVFLRHFPYKVFYQIIDDRVIVFRLLHSRQDHGRGLGNRG